MKSRKKFSLSVVYVIGKGDFYVYSMPKEIHRVEQNLFSLNQMSNEVDR